MSAVQKSLIGEVAHQLEAFWCDVHGVWISGWAQAHGTKIDSGFLQSDSARSEIIEFCPRPDVKPPFPAIDGSSVLGFSGYLPCQPLRPVTLSLVTQHRTLAIELAAPAQPREPEVPTTFEHFVKLMKRMGGTVLEIGARVVGLESSLQASRFQPECQFLGCDIHDAEGVDVVADAHFLSQAVDRGTLGGVFSLAVLEHIAAPWVLAAEINKVLKPGGLTFHVLPQTFPVHEMPNDFWRMTDEALKILFCRGLGFEVLEAGMAQPMQILPPPSLRQGSRLHMPTFRGFSASYILARKIAEIPDGAVKWPMQRDEMSRRSHAYPPHDAKPAEPDGKATSLVESTSSNCLVCQSPGPHHVAARVENAGSVHVLFRCENCASHFYDPVPRPDYHQHTSNAYSIKAYVESGAGIIVFTTNIAPALGAKRRGAFLDIGCGYGFSVDFVRQMYGWDVLGVEPSQYGDAGAKVLGFPLHRELLTNPQQLQGRKFDVIHSSEVIEHVESPFGFLQLVRTLLQDDGTFVMTTPSSRAVDELDLPWARRMAALSPGFHTCLLSKTALEELLQRAGFNDYTVTDEHGGLRAYASPSSLRLTPVNDPRELYWSYLESGIARTSSGSPTRIGFFSRLFESLVGAGAYERAMRLWNANDIEVPAVVPEFANFAAFMDALPCGAPALFFARAMCGLNFEKDAARASHWFGIAAEICKAKIKVASRSAVVEGPLFWNARFHQALAAVMAGDIERGRAIAKEIVEAGASTSGADEMLGRPSDGIGERACQLLG